MAGKPKESGAPATPGWKARLGPRVRSELKGIALGLVNSYLKNLIAKGYITVKAIPPKRYTYYLTPTGFADSLRGTS